MGLTPEEFEKIEQNRTRRFVDFDKGGYHADADDEGPDGETNLVCSDINDDSMGHYPAIDLDVPAYLIPSTTEGHTHLYINHQVSWDNYCYLLDALAACGIVEQGYVNAAKSRCYTSLRLPWIKKTEKKAELTFDEILP